MCVERRDRVKECCGEVVKAEKGVEVWGPAGGVVYVGYAVYMCFDASRD